MGLAFGRYFLRTADLHYGLWPDDLEIRPENVKRAQELHSELILSTIPKGTRTILDVGCGAGALAKRLMERDYVVEGVSPSGPLTEEARKTIGPDGVIHAAPFEKLETNQRYDVILFSESYQYIDIQRSLEQCIALLNPGGHVLICDFFRRPGTPRGPIGGGHRWETFEEKMSAHPFTLLLDRDITRETARNYDLINSALMDVGVPAWRLAFQYLAANYPRATRLGKRLFRKRLEKLERKYFSGQRTSATFEEYKTYRLLLYRLS